MAGVPGTAGWLVARKRPVTTAPVRCGCRQCLPGRRLYRVSQNVEVRFSEALGLEIQTLRVSELLQRPGKVKQRRRLAVMQLAAGRSAK